MIYFYIDIIDIIANMCVKYVPSKYNHISELNLKTVFGTNKFDKFELNKIVESSNKLLIINILACFMQRFVFNNITKNYINIIEDDNLNDFNNHLFKNKLILIGPHYGCYFTHSEWYKRFAFKYNKSILTNFKISVSPRKFVSFALNLVLGVDKLKGNIDFIRSGNSVYNTLKTCNHDIVIILPDHHNKKDNVVNYLNTKVSLPTGTARLHLDTARPIYMCLCEYKNKTIYYKFVPVLTNYNPNRTIQEITQIIASAMTTPILENPEQYMWGNKLIKK